MYCIGNTFSRLAKFAQNPAILRSPSASSRRAELVQGERLFPPKKTKDAPIQDVLRKSLLQATDQAACGEKA
jgi:hypothetical protein